MWGFILLLRLKNKNKVFKKSVNYFLALMKDAKKTIKNIFFHKQKKQNPMKITKKFSLILCFFFLSQIVYSQEFVLDKDYFWLIADIIPMVNKVFEKSNVVGMSVALVDDEEIVWAQGFGYSDKANLQEATAETIYRIGSISKLFTSLATMQLHEQGMIHIDSAYKKYVPEFSINSRYGAITDITPRNIMTHHSGLPGDLFNGLLTYRAEPFQSILETLENEYTAYPVNYVHSYSNIAMSLLGIMVEGVSQKPFHQYIADSIFIPMKMYHSSFIQPDSLMQLYSKGYKKQTEYQDPDIREVPAGLMISNVLDLAQLMKMMFNYGKCEGQKIIEMETLDEMMRPQNENISLDGKMKMGLGFFLSEDGMEFAGTFAGHGGDTEVFHAIFSTLPDYKLGVVVLTNSEEGSSINNVIANRILTEVVEKKAGISDISTKENIMLLSPKVDDLEYLEGFYSFSGRLLKIKLRNNILHARLEKLHLRLIPNTAASYTLQMRLAGIVPLTLRNQQINFDSIAGELILKYGNTVIGKKVEKTVIEDVWKLRVGKYEVINDKNNIYKMEKTEIYIEEGFLMLKSLFFDSKLIKILQPLNSNQALIPGIGRSQNETIYFTKNENGEEIFHFSGFELVKIEE